LRGGSEVSALDSNEFAIPPTGQLALTVFARSQNIDARTPMRIVFESIDPGRQYRRSFIVGGAQSGSQRLEPEWRPYAILVNDAPAGVDARMRVSFELTGPGEVWLDNIKLYDLLFPLKFYPNSSAEIKQLMILIHAAEGTVETGRVADSVRLLEEYWPRFIMEYTPQSKPPAAIGAAEAKAAHELPPPPNEDEKPAPSISERIKRFVPFVR
jgi:hypothetical protein